MPDIERRNVLGTVFASTLFPGRAPAGHVLLTSFVGGVRNPDLANADHSTLTARVLDDLRLLLGVRGEPTFRAYHLWPKAIPQYTLSYGRFKEIMDEAERRNPGLALAGSYRDGVAVGDVVAAADAAATRVAEQVGTGQGTGGRDRGGGAPCRHARQRAGAVADRARPRAAEGRGHATERIEIRTTGDIVQDVPLARIGSAALFTRQIDDAMLAGTIDIAVHSLKDLPTALPAGIALVAIGEREDPSDALVGRGPLRWADLPRGATVATSSLRRRAQLLHAPDGSPDR